MTDPTPAEIQAGADAIARSWRPLSPTSRRHLAKLVLAAVLPDHDARVRADERQRMEAAGWRPPIHHGDPHMLAAAYGYELGEQDARADERRRVAEVRRLRHQYGKVAGELADATMTMWHLEPGDRSDMPLAERITTLVAELARQRDAAAAERDRIRSEMERCVWIDPRRQSGTPCLGGTRISAYIIARLIANDKTPEQIRDMYPDVTDGHLRAVAAFMAERDTARRDGAADALAYAAQWIRKVFTGIDPEVGRVLDAMEYSVRAGVRTIPTGGGDQP